MDRCSRRSCKKHIVHKGVPLIVKQPNYDALYFIEESPYGEQVCLYVTDTFKDGCICYDGLDRGHMIRGGISKIIDNGFEFLDKEDRLWRFTEVTIDSYKEHVYKFVWDGEEIASKCNTTEELVDYYHKLYPDTNKK